MRRVAALLLIAAAMLACPSALAVTEGHWTDSPSDVEMFPGGLGVHTAATDAADLVGLSIRDDGTTVTFTFHVQGLAGRTGLPADGQRLQYATIYSSFAAGRNFTRGGTTFDILAAYGGATKGWTWQVFDGPTVTDVTGVVDLAASTVAVSVPSALMQTGPGDAFMPVASAAYGLVDLSPAGLGQSCAPGDCGFDLLTGDHLFRHTEGMPTVEPAQPTFYGAGGIPISPQTAATWLTIAATIVAGLFWWSRRDRELG